MSDESGWFSGLEPDDTESAVSRIQTGRGSTPSDWPRLAVESGVAEDEAEYYEWLHRVTVAAARAETREIERADDRQLINAIRAMDDTERVVNELTERITEWAGTRYGTVEAGHAGRRSIAERDPEEPADVRLVSLAETTETLASEADELRALVEQQASAVAPNLTALAGPILAARLIALAGGLDALAKQPSGTIQVLGAENALFAHLRGRAPSPKHGVIYVHEYVRSAPPDRRGAAARVLAGKLAIAARIDNYSGDLRPELEADLAERMERLVDRGGGR